MDHDEKTKMLGVYQQQLGGSPPQMIFSCGAEMKVNAIRARRWWIQNVGGVQYASAVVNSLRHFSLRVKSRPTPDSVLRYSAALDGKHVIARRLTRFSNSLPEGLRESTWLPAVASGAILLLFTTALTDTLVISVLPPLRQRD